MLLRIGDKVVNKQKIHQMIEQILEMRIHGFSQQEAASILGIDRTFISRLESIGEIRKGGRIAVVGFPVKNGEEIQALAHQEGVDYCLVLSEKERWDFVQQRSGIELFNTMMDLITELRKYDIVIMIASDMRIKLVQALIGKDVIGIQIGESPIAEDKYVNVAEIQSIIQQLRLAEAL